MNRLLKGAVFLLLCLSLPTQSFAKPATTVKIPDLSSYKPGDDSHWFTRLDLSEDIPFKGASGFGVSAGHRWKAVFVDFSAMYFSAKYGALRVNQTGSVGATTTSIDNGDGTSTTTTTNNNTSLITPGAEIGRDRTDSGSGSIFAVGPGVGGLFQLFGDDHWVEIGRFGVSYMQYNDNATPLTLRGPGVQLQGSIGYRVSDNTLLAPGVTWNMGFLKRTTGMTAEEVGYDDDAAHRFLPVQWWSWSLSLYVWL